MRIKGMKTPPLQMEYYYFPEIDFRINLPKKELHPDDCGVDFDIKTSISKFESDELCYKVNLRIKTKEINGKFKIYDANILAVGFFKIEEDVPTEKHGEIAGILGANLLYGAARELFYILTSRGPHRALLLPTTSFVPEPPETQNDSPEQSKITVKKKKISQKAR